jgi:hypothetical protein
VGALRARGLVRMGRSSGLCVLHSLLGSARRRAHGAGTPSFPHSAAEADLGRTRKSIGSPNRSSPSSWPDSRSRVATSCRSSST